MVSGREYCDPRGGELGSYRRQRVHSTLGVVGRNGGWCDVGDGLASRHRTFGLVVGDLAELERVQRLTELLYPTRRTQVWLRVKLTCEFIHRHVIIDLAYTLPACVLIGFMAYVDGMTYG